MQKRFVFATFAVAVAVAVPSVFAQSKGMGRINGVVVSEAGEPVDGVSIKAPLSSGGAIESKSSERGTFALGGIGKGEWQVEFDKPGFEAKRLKVIVQKETLNPEAIKVVLKKSN